MKRIINVLMIMLFCVSLESCLSLGALSSFVSSGSDNEPSRAVETSVGQQTVSNANERKTVAAISETVPFDEAVQNVVDYFKSGKTFKIVTTDPYSVENSETDVFVVNDEKQFLEDLEKLGFYVSLDSTKFTAEEKVKNDPMILNAYMAMMPLVWNGRDSAVTWGMLNVQYSEGKGNHNGWIVEILPYMRVYNKQNQMNGRYEMDHYDYYFLDFE